MEIGQTLSVEELNYCKHISTLGIYEIYQADEDVEYIFAIDSKNLICCCFEFVEQEDGYILAHMHTIKALKGQGLGTQILKEATVKYDTFKFPSTDTNDTYYFIEDGYDWIQRRFDKGPLSSPPFRRP